MNTNEDLEKKADGEEPEAPEAEADHKSAEDAPAPKAADAKGETRAKSKSSSDDEPLDIGEKSSTGSKSQEDADADAIEREKADESRQVMAPTQLGYRRFVYAAYFGGAIAVAFIGTKLFNMLWFRLSQWKPTWDLGDPKDEIIMPLAAITGVLVALYYYRRPKSRVYVDEVANELSQVTWPNRKEVTSSTAVVIVTTVFATVFFALMDRFWGFVTNLVYGS